MTGESHTPLPSVLEGDLAPELYAVLAPYLLESVAVVRADGRVQAMLGPPGGALGLSEVVGRHIFEYCLEADVPRALELAVEALSSSSGWSTTWQTRLKKANGELADFEIHIENHQSDPLIDGFVLRLRELPSITIGGAPLFRSELGVELETLAGAVPLAIIFIGSDGNLYFPNEAGREFCRDIREELESEGFAALASAEDRPELEAVVSSLLGGPGEQTVRFKMAGGPPGVTRMVEARLSGLGQGNQVLALVATLVDVTERHFEESELRRRAQSDPLTGVLNRNELDDEIGGRLERNAHRVSLLYVDLDGFKAVNDTRGHEAGDEFLVAVASILTSTARSGDLVARLGGDEFVVVVDSDDPGGADDAASRIESAIALHASSIGLGVTASVGVATGVTGDTARDLLRRADRAMYEIKRTRQLTA